MSLRPYRQRGLSLVELMVALTIGLMILSAATTIMVTSKITYTTQDSLARLQENARFAIHLVSRDIRMAGYYGCADQVSTVSNQLNAGAPNSDWFDFTQAVEGADSAGTLYPSNASITPATGVTRVAGSNAFALRYAEPSDQILLVSEMTQQSASMKVASNSGLNPGEIVMITDCDGADIFQITNLNPAGGFDNVIHNTGSGQWPGNSTDNNPHKLSKAYRADARIMRFNSVRYYIGEKADGVRSLFRQTVVGSGGNASTQHMELVEGVEDMRVTYGVDMDGDKIPDRYLKAGAPGLTSALHWENVVSMRVGFLFSTVANTDANQPGKTFGTQIDEKVYDVNGDVVNPPDTRRERRVFLTTVTVRNRK